MPMQKAIRAASVDHALGVHSDMTQGNWSNIETMISQARYAGIDTIRVGVPTPGSWFASSISKLAEAGIKLEMVVDTTWSPEANARAVADFSKAHPGALAFVEGPNEPSNWGVNYGGQGGMEGARRWQNDFYAAMNANPATRDIPVSGPSSHIATNSDLVTIHPYARDGDQPGAWILEDLRAAQAVDPGKGFVITETGYYTLPGSNPSGVDDATQAKFTINTYLDAISLGAINVGFFALRDWQNPNWDSYGLFYGDNTPKPAARALHNMQAILQDDGARAESFSPGQLDFTNSVPADVQTLLMQKSSGEYVLALWREPDIWNETSQRQIGSSTSSFTLKIGAATEFSIYDPLLGDTAIRREESSTGLALTMTDHPLFITFKPDQPGSGAAPPKTKVPVFTTFGTGPDELVIRVSEDDYNGHAQYTVKVDGVQIGGEYTAFASHDAGGSDTLLIKGDWRSGGHRLEIAFTNDAWDGSEANDRNLYIDEVSYNGVVTVSSTVVMTSSGVSQSSFSDEDRSLNGDEGDNTITGTSGSDSIKGLGGDDRLNGGAGRDVLDGGDGDDILDGGTGADRMIGGAGDDTYFVDNAGDVVVEKAGEGSNRVYVSADWTVSDNIQRVDLTSAVTLTGNAERNFVYGSAGNDHILGLDGRDGLYGGAGDDTLEGGAGKDVLDGGTGADLMIGGSGNDTYFVDNAGDVVVELVGGGSDRVYVSANWTVSDNLQRIILTEAVTLTGNGQVNVVYGSAGNDRVLGQEGNDRLYGDAGKDTLEGGDGEDLLVGGLGADRLDGGAGADTFYYGAAAEGGDLIRDFVSGEDVIEILATDFGGGLTPGNLKPAQFTANLTGQSNSKAGVGQFVYETDTGRLWWDVDGAGGQGGTLLATLSGHPALSASDIHLVG